MRKFRFKLEAVERVRKSKERDALRVLAAAQRALQTEKDRKNELEMRLNESLTRREQWPNRESRLSILSVEENFIQGTKSRIQHAEMAIRRAERKVEKAMAHYLAARQQLRMIEKLREKAFKEFQEEQALRETRELDDLSIMRARFRSEDEEVA